MCWKVSIKVPFYPPTCNSCSSHREPKFSSPTCVDFEVNREKAAFHVDRTEGEYCRVARKGTICGIEGKCWNPK